MVVGRRVRARRSILCCSRVGDRLVLSLRGRNRQRENFSLFPLFSFDFLKKYQGWTHQDTEHTILPPSEPLPLPLLLPIVDAAVGDDADAISSTSSFAAASISVPPMLSSKDRPRLRCALPFAMGATWVCRVTERNSWSERPSPRSGLRDCRDVWM